MTRSLLAALVVVSVLGGDLAAQLKDTVTFRVNMSIMMREGKFNPSTDIVRVAGSFNGWGGTTDTLKSTGSTDSIYTKQIVIDSAGVGSSISYKFLKTLRGGLDWEGDPNRSYTLVNGRHTLPVVWFNQDSVYTPPSNVNVTFRVNMSVKIREQSFRPDLGDIVRVAGSFNGWGGSTDTLVKGASDSIYSKTITLQENQSIMYKFLKTPRGGVDWEGGSDKSYTVGSSATSLPVVWFDGDSVVNIPVTANILWQTDMSAFITLGWFDPTKDSVQVRGGFNGWSGDIMRSNVINPSTFEVTRSYTGTVGDELSYKHFIKYDSVSAVARFGAAFNNDRDNVAYEHPVARGDGNNIYVVGAGTNQGPALTPYSGIPSSGLLTASDSVNVTVSVNMGPAKRYSNPFNPAQDTVKLVIFNAQWYGSQQRIQGVFPASRNMTQATGGGDSIYTVTFKVKGPTHYNLMYYYRYVRADQSTVDEGGGLGAQKPYRSRFIVKGANWPASYSTPQDQWQKNSPMPVETFPGGPTGVETGGSVPLVYTLQQNYPNPFNPTTTISFNIPVKSEVRLSVYNLLGQQVAELLNRELQAGEHIVGFEARTLPSGVYFYRLEAGSYRAMRKMVLMK